METTFLKALSGLSFWSGEWHDQLRLTFTWKEDAREERNFMNRSWDWLYLFFKICITSTITDTLIWFLHSNFFWYPSSKVNVQNTGSQPPAPFFLSQRKYRVTKWDLWVQCRKDEILPNSSELTVLFLIICILLHVPPGVIQTLKYENIKWTPLRMIH